MIFVLISLYRIQDIDKCFEISFLFWFFGLIMYKSNEAKNKLMGGARMLENRYKIIKLFHMLKKAQAC